MTQVKVFKTELLEHTANMLKDAGLKVYYSANKDGEIDSPVTYFNFTDGVNIGYCQDNYFGGVTFSTVHKPNKNCGTGFGLQDYHHGIFEPTLQDAKEAFIIAPNWATANDRASVTKYKNWDEYAAKESHWRTFIEY